MKNLLSVIFFLCFMLSTLQVHAQNSETFVFHKMSVLTMETDEVLRDYSIIVENDEIVWVGPSSEVKIPEGATVIEGDVYVMPGLAEMHAHIPPQNQGEQRMKDTLVLYLSQGITTIRGMLGQPAHLELREQAARGEIISPRIFTSGPSFNANSVQNAEQAREMVRNQVEAGYDLLKFHPGIQPEYFDAITDEANTLGIEFSGHISHRVGLVRSLEAGKGSIDHLDRYMEYLSGDPEDREDPPIIYFGYDLAFDADVEKIPEAVRITREADVWNVHTNTLLENIFNPDNDVEDMKNWPGMEFIPSSTLEGWGNFVTNLRSSEVYNEEQARKFLQIRLDLTRALHEEGAGLLLGADAPQIFNPPGFSIFRELELLTRAGLSNFEALKTGTVNVGIYLGEENKTGKIAEGFRADLIFLSSNPLDDIMFYNNIEGVMAQGRFLIRFDLDELLEEIKERVD